MKTFYIDRKVLNKLPRKIQPFVTFAEYDDWRKYHIVVHSPKYKEASFHGTNLKGLIWEITEFCKDGSRY